MFPSTTRLLPASSPAVRSVATLAALLASICAIGTIDGLAQHYALQASATSVARSAGALRCSAPTTVPPTRQAS